MPNPTIIPASREEIAARLMTAPVSLYSRLAVYQNELRLNKLIAPHEPDWLARADLILSWLSAAREQGRSEGLEKGLEIVSNSESVGGAFNRLRAAILAAQGREGT